MSPAPPEASLSKLFAEIHFSLFCTLIFFLGNMMSKTTFHFRERLFFFFQIYGDCPSSHINLVENNVFHPNSYAHGLCYRVAPPSIRPTASLHVQQTEQKRFSNIKLPSSVSIKEQCVNTPTEETVVYGIIYIIYSVYCDPDE